MITDSIIVLSSFSGSFLQKSLLNSDRLFPLSIVPLTQEVQNEQVFFTQIKKIQNRGELPVILSNVSDAFSIRDQYPSLSFFFVFAAPNSAEEYFRDTQENVKNENDLIWNMEQAAQECDVLWKYDLIIPLNRLYSIAFESNENATAEYFDGFEILQIKESLIAHLQALKTSGTIEQIY